MQPEYCGLRTRNCWNNNVHRQTRNIRSNTACQTGNSRINTAHRTKNIWRLAKLPPNHINFLFCCRDSFVKLLTASTDFETARHKKPTTTDTEGQPKNDN